MNSVVHAIRFTKQIYRHILSASVRRSRWISKLKQGLLWHQILYDLDYYDNQVEGPSSQSAPIICESIYAEFRPKRVIDVGCGTGALLEKFRDRGCEVLGLDYSEAALVFCRVRHLNVLKFDLESEAFADITRFDVAVSLEVAEHLPPEVANRYVYLLTRLSPVIIFSAAPPGYGGSDHVNEQPPGYWIAKFKRCGYVYQESLSRRWSHDWKMSGNVASCYYDHLMIFIHSGKTVAQFPASINAHSPMAINPMPATSGSEASYEGRESGYHTSR
ncbi:MAG TPA: class I SAM-dependent methyltransferase [Nitrospira sp.]|nr:class I SAM-dependent methyltransferase [Nitrospira sp.]